MSEHGPAIMGHQNPAFLCRSIQEFGIADPFQARFGSRGEVDAGLSLSDRLNDGVFEIGIRLKANAQGRGSPVLARARCNFSQSAGFACCNGMALSSNSRSVRARYSSISCWWSK